MSVSKFTAHPLARRGAGPSGHPLVPAAAGVGSDLVITEWELRGESWTDRHPHTEYNYVLDGVLFVESEGNTVEAHRGDVVLVGAGTVGRYWAPDYARLLAVYGPNPTGAPSEVVGLAPVES
jgi:uncharacterized cupin superfamily protein